jgi:glucose-6-phosphate-specific signal transduction histidine kinase
MQTTYGLKSATTEEFLAKISSLSSSTAFGLRGMQERIRKLGGTARISSSNAAQTVAVVPAFTVAPH